MSGVPQIGSGNGPSPRASRAPIPKLPHVDDPRFEARTLGTGNSQPGMAESRVNPQGCAQDARNNSALPTLFVFADVLEEICYRAVYEPEVAAACILVGGWFVGPKGPYVEVDGFRDFLHASDPMRLLNTLRSQPSLLEEEEAAIVGCAQIQPGCGGRMSASHLILQNTFFNGTHQVLLLIDPKDESVAFYQRDAAGLFHNVAFTLLNDIKEDETPVETEPEVAETVPASAAQEAGTEPAALAVAGDDVDANE